MQNLSNQGQKILMLIAKHNEELEVHVPYYAFSALGFEVHVASPYKSKGTCIDMAIFDFEDEEGERNYQLKLGHPFKTTLDFNAIGVEDYDGLYIPGGDSYVEFCESKETLEMVRYFLGAKKPLGAVCTGLQVLLAAGGLDGAKVTGFKREGMAEMVKQAGGLYQEMKDWEICQHGNLVTTPGWLGLPLLIAAFSKKLGTHIIPINHGDKNKSILSMDIIAIYSQFAKRLSYPIQGFSNIGLLDNKNLGILPGSIADCFLVQYGDPFDSQSLLYANEVRLMETVGKFMGFQDPYGYVTSGGSEANYACIWWSLTILNEKTKDIRQLLKTQLKQTESLGQVKSVQAQLKILKRAILFCSTETHYCIFKLASQLGLKVIKIEANQKGEIVVEEFQKALAKFETFQHLNFIVNCNFGTTFKAGIDDIPAIKRVCEQYCTKQPDWKYSLHMDGAFYGPTLPILKQYGSIKIEELVDTIALSLHKFFGSQYVSGIALSSSNYLKQGVIVDKEFVGYSGIKDQLLVFGSRPSLPVLIGLNICDQLELDKGNAKMEEIISHNLEMANYIVSLLKSCKHIDPSKIYQNYFTVIIPAEYVNEQMIQDHVLMKQGDQISLVLKYGATKELLDKFFAKVKSHCEKQILINAVDKISNNEYISFKDVINGLQYDHYSQISLEKGFNIDPCLRKLGPAYSEYEYLFENQNFFISTFKIQQKVKELKLVTFVDHNLLPDCDILRAQFVVCCLAASYFYHDRPHIVYADLPEQISIPMKELKQRRDDLYYGKIPGPVGKSCIEAFIGNWQFNKNFTKDSYEQADVNVKNIELMYTHLGMQEEAVVSLVSGPLTCAVLAPVFKIFSRLEDTEEEQDLLKIIEELNDIMVECLRVINYIQPKVGQPHFCDQVLFIKTQPTLVRSTYPEEPHQTAGDQPAFRIYDGLVGRTLWNSSVGYAMKERDTKIPVAYQLIFKKMSQMSGKLLERVYNSPLLQESYKKLALNYAGPHGYLEQHRRRIYSYSMLGFISGRLQTNGHFDAAQHKEPEKDLNKEMWEAVKERLQTNLLFKDYEWPKLTLQIPETPTNLIKKHEVIFHNQQDKALFIVNNNVYDLTKYLKLHAGGNKILMTHAGTDITTALEQVHMFDLDKVNQSIGKYLVGALDMSCQNELYELICKSMMILTLQQNYVSQLWIFDESVIFDNKRKVPYHFIQKLPMMIYSESGYLVQFFTSTSQEAKSAYLGMHIDTFLGQKLGKEIKLTTIGDFLSEKALLELNNAKDIESTLLQNMAIGDEMTQIIDLYFDFTNDIKKYYFSKADVASQEEFTESDIEEDILKRVQEFKNKIEGGNRINSTEGQ